MAKNILVVDDEQRVLAVVRSMLRGRGHTVRLASSGEEALELIGQELPDLLLLDLVLPGIDGSTVAQRLRDHPETSELPIVFLTGLVESSVNRRRGARFGGHYFLAKPFDAEELDDVIELALAERARSQTAG